MVISISITRIAVAILAAITSTALLATTDAEIEKLLAKVSREINAKLPLGTAEVTIVSVVAGPGKRFEYHSVISTPATQWTPAMKIRAGRQLIDDYCTAPEMKDFRSLGVTVSWISSDQEGVHIYTNTVTPQNCRWTGPRTLKK